MGGHYRLIINKVKAEHPIMDTPHLVVAKVLWKRESSLAESVEARIYAGGTYHTVFSFDVITEQLYDFADMVKFGCDDRYGYKY